MKKFKEFIMEGSGEVLVSKLVGLAFDKWNKVTKQRKKEYQDHLDKHKPIDDTTSHETDNIKKFRNKEDRENFKRFKDYHKKNYKNWEKVYGPDKIKSPDDYDPRPASDIDFEAKHSKPEDLSSPIKKKKKKPNWRSDSENQDILDSLFKNDK